MKVRMQGMTLIELMVVIVIVAILASIAIPSYRNYLVRSNRTEATTALLQARSAQEKFFLQNGQYATQAQMYQTLAAGGLGLTAVTPSGNYAIDLPVRTATTFTARARPQAGQADDEDCQSMTIDQDGTRVSTPAAMGICFR